VVGLAQFRIKRLFAYSTISHVGFILLGLSINSIESIQAFIFYLMQYTISNLNVFLILISVGFSLYYFINPTEEYKELEDKDNSPIQLISQLKGYFNINPYLALSLTITIFSFAGVPPMIGFFSKQMVLSAALDSGYIFIVLVAILASVVSAVYYLNVVKQVFFDPSIYTDKPDISCGGSVYFGPVALSGETSERTIDAVIIVSKNGIMRSLYLPSFMLQIIRFITIRQPITITRDNITLSSSLTVTISLLTSTLFLFIFMPME
jgi:NADH-ubiquinone oxidoreductase chain 2